MNRVPALLFVLLSLLSGGCAINSTPAMESYTIETDCRSRHAATAQGHSGTVLKLALPQSPSALVSRDILYQDGEFAQNPYAYSNWSDSPNRMLGNLFLSCIDSSGIFGAVLPPYSEGRGDLLLESTLSVFHHRINKDGSSEGRVSIRFYLVDPDDGRVIASKAFSSHVGATSLDARGGVRALNDASAHIASLLTRWLASPGVLGNH